MIDQEQLLQRLTTIVETVPHRDLEAAVVAESGGPGATLDAVFALLASEFNPAKAKGRTGRFQFEIATTTGTILYYVLVENDTCVTEPGQLPEADVTIGIKYPDMLLMGMGKLPGARAFMTGKLKLRGNPLFGTKLGEWFDHPQAA